MVMIDESDNGFCQIHVDEKDYDDDNGGIEKTWDTLMVIDDDVQP